MPTNVNQVHLYTFSRMIDRLLSDATVLSWLCWFASTFKVDFALVVLRSELVEPLGRDLRLLLELLPVGRGVGSEIRHIFPVLFLS